MTNLVIFIRFSDEDVSVFSNPLSTYMNMLTTHRGCGLAAELLPGGILECIDHQLSSFPKLYKISHFSYQDSHTRSYFEPYNATTNPGGYTGGDNSSDRALREQALFPTRSLMLMVWVSFPAGRP